MTINGIGVSPGIAIGKAHLLRKQEAALSGVVLLNEADIAIETDKFNNAVALSVQEVEAMISNYDQSQGNEGLEILETHIELLSDPQISEDVTGKISKEKKNVNDALIEVIADAVQLFKNMDDEYLSARAADVQDIGNRLLRNLSFSAPTHAPHYETDTIIIAEDLTPSDTISMDTTHVVGFATQAGGRTSHAAIIARSRGIPAIVGCGVTLMNIKNGDQLILDGQSGDIIINPAQEIVKQYHVKRENWLKKNHLLRSLKDTPATTPDGINIKLFANIGNANDMEQAISFGAEGSGLLRTELLFMGRDALPGEDEQFEFYKAVALKAKGKPVIVRTLDIGGDKQLPYFNFPTEQNPFLGYRAIRICLDRPDIFITQLKAILRASAFGQLKIMFPMISNIQEVRAAKVILQQAKDELTKAGITFDKNIPVGIMIEIPSAAITADLLAKEVDFFSIGTNDLCQYTLAVDRMNEQIKDLYDPYNPGVLRLIAYVIEQGHKNNVEVGMCGELASDSKATLLLLGMGLTEFSMSATAIPEIKNIIINSLLVAKEIHQRVMEMDSSALITAYLQEITL
ncbi:phosphotransferase system, enzyme I, PtsI [Mucilaginibacter lappiensis]|uniref:Phosphoenolpyruvate-protein phosphotransferase n=1 Tax=Mucilaginibacter lappiensis TaxID=354630 RepID=A0ABR6PQP8_9SPHI|nr:phosphoenolpyruvate--protein phosphotransferase [Mucilaginibacter lappiensis]MBB6110596.1 phosphotransferase system enzyme I (PtsI) [Mucilaginibacter lappiensis]SIR42576.1 phosphotransferase system, enzyme I, PtsI [Mucilaginibacter lappiensis]